MANAMEGSGQLHRRIGNVIALLCQSVAGERILQLGYRADVAGMQFRNGLERFSLRATQMGQPLGRAAIHILQIGIVLYHPGENLKKVMRPAKGSAVVLKT